jgi:hypothetical protein
MSIWKRPEVVLVAIAASSLGVYIVSRRAPPSVLGSVDTALSGSVPSVLAPNTRDPLPSTSVNDDTSADSDPALPTYRGPERNPQKAALLREALIARKAQQLSAAPTASAASSSPEGVMVEPGGQRAPEAKPLDNYVSRLMQQQFLPLATECYEVLLATKPHATGTVALEFSILGDAAVGGVVVDVTFGAGTTLLDPPFSACMTELMYAVIFDPPPGKDGSVSVEQSFELAP